MVDLPVRWKSDGLYKIIPIIYFVAGLVAILIFDTTPGYGASALLLLAACLIWMMLNQNST